MADIGSNNVPRTVPCWTNINLAQHQPTHSAIYLIKTMIQLSSNLTFIIINWLTLHKAQSFSESPVSLL